MPKGKIKCPSCKREDFESEGGMKIHHYRTHGESIAKEEGTCNNCGTHFEYYPTDKPGKYCSTCVEEGKYHTGPKLFGEDNPNYNSVESTCQYCGQPLQVRKSSFKKYNSHFCDMECYGLWRGKSQWGENNPNYTDGRNNSEIYIGTWSKNKKEVLRRDQYRCQNCYKTEAKIGRKPDVHHIQKARSFETLLEAHQKENLISLCPECHFGEEQRE